MLRYFTVLFYLCPILLVHGDFLTSTSYFTHFNKRKFGFNDCDNGILAALYKAISLPPDFDIASATNILAEISKLLPKEPSNDPNSDTTKAPTTVRLLAEKTAEEVVRSQEPKLSKDEKQWLSADQIVLGASFKQQREAHQKLSEFSKTVSLPGADTLLASALGQLPMFSIFFPEEKQAPSGQTKPEDIDLSILEPLQATVLHFLSPEFKTFLHEFLHERINVTGVPIFYTANTTIVEALCQTTQEASQQQLVNSSMYHACAFQNLLAAFITCRDSDHILICNTTHNPTTYSPPKTPGATENAVTFEFEDLRSVSGMTPLTISKEMFDKEVASYFYLFRCAQVSALFSLEYYPCKFPKTETFIPGWELVYVGAYKTEKSKYSSEKNLKEYSLFNLLRPTTPSENCHYVVSIRGTLSGREWLYDILFKMTPFFSKKEMVHSGFAVLMRDIINDAIRAFRDIDAFTSCRTTAIITTGHSLGGILSQLVAAGLAEIYPFVKVTAFSSGSPRGYNEEFLTRFRKTVNSRSIKNKLDLVTELPCAKPTYNGTYACDSDVFYNKKKWQPYVNPPGLYEFHNETHYERWGVSNKFAEIKIAGGVGATLHFPTSLQSSAVHGCAYACKLSEGFFGASAALDNTWQCKICPEILQPITF